MIKTKLFAGVLLISVLSLLFGACVSPTPSLTPTSPLSPAPQSALGNVAVYVTDAPPEKEVTAVLLTISQLEIHKAVTEQEQEQEQSGSDNETPKREREQEQEQDQEGQGEWIIIDISDNMATFDLLEVKGIKEFFGGAEVEAGKYTQLRLIVDKAEVTTGDNVTQEATIPSQEVKIVRPFDVKVGETTTILLDFDAEHSVVFTGSGKIQVKPVVKISIEQESQSGKPEEAAGKEEDEEKEQSEEIEESVEGISLEVSYEEFQDENHITREVEISVDSQLEVTLYSNASTGFQWSEMAEIGDSAILEQTSHEFQSPQPQSGQNPLPGAPGKEIWTFHALKEGTTKIYLDYSRPWQGGEKGEWTFELTVTVA